MSTQEKMFALVEEYRQSGLTAKAFCEQKNIGLPKFNYWVRKRREQNTPSGFIKISADQKITNIPAELIYPNGVRLQLATPDPVLIASLLKIY